MQWRALVMTAVRVDLRTTGPINLSRTGSSDGTRSLAGFVGSLVLVSVFLALLMLVARDLFFSLIFLFSFVIFSIGSSLLIEFHSIVLSPDDHRRLAYHPIDSRTFFAARVAAVLAYVGIMAAALGTLPLLALLLKRGGGGVTVACAVLAGLVVATLTTTFLAIGAYVTLLRYVSTARLKRALTYLQLAATFLVYGSYFLLPKLLGDRAMTGQIIEPRGWVLALPGAWYAGYVDVVSGRATLLQVALAMATLILCALSIRMMAGRLSIDYADRLALLESHTASAATPAATRARPGWLFRDGERRAIALLVRGLFRHDMKFRLGVLSIVPLTLVYLFAGEGPSGMSDPFEEAPRGGPQFVYFAVLFFPSMVRQALSKSDAFRAAWILHATPADSARLVLGMKDFVLMAFVAPYLLFVGALVAWWFVRLDHLALLLLTLALLSHLIVTLELWINPQLPFSQPATKGSRTRDVLLLVMFVSLLAPLLPPLLHVAFATPTRMAGALGGLVLVNLGLLRVTTRRVRRLASAAEFNL